MKSRKKIGIGNEGRLHKDFASIVRQYESYKKLDVLLWSYFPSGEKRSAITGALLKAKGLAKGIPDYFFIQKRSVISAFEPEYDVKIVFIEFKFGKGKQSYSQVEFEKKMGGLQNVTYRLCYSVEEAINVLLKEKIIKQ